MKHIEMRFIGDKLQIFGAIDNGLHFYALVDKPAKMKGLVVHNQLKPADVGTTRVIDGKTYTVAGHGGTATIDVPQKPKPN